MGLPIVSLFPLVKGRQQRNPITHFISLLSLSPHSAETETYPDHFFPIFFPFLNDLPLPASASLE